MTKPIKSVCISLRRSGKKEVYGKPNYAYPKGAFFVIGMSDRTVSIPYDLIERVEEERSY